MRSDGDPWSLFQASSGGSEPPVSSVSTIAPRSAGITSRISSNSARTGKELSREAKVRLEWMDFCRRTQNVPVLAAISGSVARLSTAGSAERNRALGDHLYQTL